MSERKDYSGKQFHIKNFSHPYFQDEVVIRIEGWWDDVTGGSWKWANGNPAAMIYAMRTGLKDDAVPPDDEVLYGKVGGLGVLVHETELGDEVTGGDK